ncbi:hypothetical protein Pint_17446 [Pistacia integerrima]|uniref:Uncharacterized protein n=1 Tax=Pistacia integerrima TaxID=434235 RepID=A0ACC0YTE9_9ROSI|nr:hypothetical protein Pint_17446 [Pistacia integerrima]
MRENHINMYHGSGSGPLVYFADSIWRPFMKSPAKSYGLFTFFFVLVVGALVSTRLLDTTTIAASGFAQRITSTKTYVYPPKPEYKLKFPLNCSSLNLTKTCPRNYPTIFNPSEDPDPSSPPMCPQYFRWIHEDLRPWAHTGITLDMVERARPTANFRLVILKGRAYVETYQRSFQTRDVFTLWGILQLLRKYPGKVPDLDMMFDCVDWPVIKSKNFAAPDAPVPPPLFRYCSDDQSLDVVFPDWSFWGWPEINIKPWEPLLEDLKEGNRRMAWENREPYAYWKGNPAVAETRKDLLKCNVSEKQDWNARVYAQNWVEASKQGYKESDLRSQCIHR